MTTLFQNMAAAQHLLEQHEAVCNPLSNETTCDTRQAVLEELDTQAGKAAANTVLTHTCT